jgi:hypothetical protein
VHTLKLVSAHAVQTQKLPQGCNRVQLEFGLQVHFALWPLITQHKKADRLDLLNRMAHFKHYLETRAAAMACHSDFLVYFALPHIPDPEKYLTEHPSFKHLFDPECMAAQRTQLEIFLSALPKQAPFPRLYTLLQADGHSARGRSMRSAAVGTERVLDVARLLDSTENLDSFIGGAPVNMSFEPRNTAAAVVKGMPDAVPFSTPPSSSVEQQEQSAVPDAVPEVVGAQNTSDLTEASESHQAPPVPTLPAAQSADTSSAMQCEGARDTEMGSGLCDKGAGCDDGDEVGAEPNEEPAMAAERPRVPTVQQQQQNLNAAPLVRQEDATGAVTATIQDRYGASDRSGADSPEISGSKSILEAREGGSAMGPYSQHDVLRHNVVNSGVTQSITRTVQEQEELPAIDWGRVHKELLARDCCTQAALLQACPLTQYRHLAARSMPTLCECV